MTAAEALAKLRLEQEVKLRLLYEVRHYIEPQIRQLEQILGGRNDEA